MQLILELSYLSSPSCLGIQSHPRAGSRSGHFICNYRPHPPPPNCLTPPASFLCLELISVARYIDCLFILFIGAFPTVLQAPLRDCYFPFLPLKHQRPAPSLAQSRHSVESRCSEGQTVSKPGFQMFKKTPSEPGPFSALFPQ